MRDLIFRFVVLLTCIGAVCLPYRTPESLFAVAWHRLVAQMFAVALLTLVASPLAKRESRARWRVLSVLFLLLGTVSLLTGLGKFWLITFLGFLLTIGFWGFRRHRNWSALPFSGVLITSYGVLGWFMVWRM